MSGGSSGRLADALAGGGSMASCYRSLRDAAGRAILSDITDRGALPRLGQPPTLLSGPLFGTALAELTGCSPDAAPDEARGHPRPRRPVRSDRATAPETALPVDRPHESTRARRPQTPGTVARPRRLPRTNGPADAPSAEGARAPRKPPDEALAPHGLVTEQLRALAGTGNPAERESVLPGPRQRRRPTRTALASRRTPLQPVRHGAGDAGRGTSPKTDVPLMAASRLHQLWRDRIESRVGIRCEPTPLGQPLRSGPEVSAELLDHLAVASRDGSTSEGPGPARDTGATSMPAAERTRVPSRREQERSRAITATGRRIEPTTPTEPAGAVRPSSGRESMWVEPVQPGPSVEPVGTGSVRATRPGADGALPDGRLPARPDFEDLFQQVLTDAARRHGIEV